MAQLSDDCFAFGGHLLQVDEALETVREHLSCVAGSQDVPVAQSLDRNLAQAIVAPRAVPPHNNSAVDGYAVYFADLVEGAETCLPIGGRLQAGDLLDGLLPRQSAVRVFTGAAMPPGPDTIFMQEDCREEDGYVVLPPGIKKGANYRFAGEDIEDGTTVLEPGCRLRPADLGLIASLGLPTVTVRKPLRIAVISTGNEITEPGDTPRSGTIYDANRYSMMGLLRHSGYEPTDAGIVKDDPEAVASTLNRLSQDHDAIVATGGVSTGEADYVKQAVEDIGGKLHAWRLAIKPGRPVALGQIGDCAFVGLPGNPVAVIVTYLMLARPLLAVLAGRVLPPLRPEPVTADFDYRKKQGRREYLRVLVSNTDGLPVAKRFPRDGAGILSSVVASDGLAVLDEDVKQIHTGDRLSFLRWSSFD
ncbi:MAG: gephyrin-like molybdotransferase Glp [Pseudomonadota bacterium]